MSFEPKIFHHDESPERVDAGSEADARADFSETREWFPTAETLAEQLHDDALRLAARFPSRALAPFDAAAMAERITVVAATRPDYISTPLYRARWRGFSLRLTAASVLLALGVGGMFAYRSGQFAVDPNDGQARVQPARAAQVFIEQDGPEAILAPQQFQTLSGAEQEAVLDLIEQQAQAQVRISI